MNEEEYDEAYAAYEQAVAEAREAAEQAARDEAVDLAHEAAREAVEALRAADNADLEEHQKIFEEQWTIFYKNYTDEANQKLKEHGISLYCSDIEYAILEDIMDEVLGDDYQGGVEVEGSYTGYDELYDQAYAEAYSAALDGLMSDYEEQSFEDFLEEYEIDDDTDNEGEGDETNLFPLSQGMFAKGDLTESLGPVEIVAGQLIQLKFTNVNILPVAFTITWDNPSFQDPSSHYLLPGQSVTVDKSHFADSVLWIFGIETGADVLMLNYEILSSWAPD
ncbi:hypothetical protein SAMN04488029_3521 [Reichenbachiella faecimaris]|uniref:Uncharacterized protein n=1 Tax=Reichenbachiella faecimaris TaxID=692418 RepID=A0A1W2GMI8_REIFA|nr:hypothetical protein [Reichenbachiella faecimaris]SMD37885.1 hypothetical protein SAMN04488029_3521 [Reichenbachiella faecimaris]